MSFVRKTGSVNETHGSLRHGVDRFGFEATGVPVVLNTSFNLKGEPIVSTIQNAYNTFAKSGMDTLVAGRFLVKKER